jgi:hypothetical protein
MRLIFGMVGLMVALVVVGLLVKSQLRAVQSLPQPMAGAAAANATAPAAMAATADSTVPAQAAALQRQTADQVGKALDAGVQRNRAAEGGK